MLVQLCNLAEVGEIGFDYGVGEIQTLLHRHAGLAQKLIREAHDKGLFAIIRRELGGQQHEVLEVDDTLRLELVAAPPMCQLRSYFEKLFHTFE